ncbi:MAG: hypothetical protein QNI95_12255 [Desulfobacterales bacterium]|nr:hypothetical protein [Desulfobacterales bacterium]
MWIEIKYGTLTDDDKAEAVELDEALFKTIEKFGFKLVDMKFDIKPGERLMRFER